MRESDEVRNSVNTYDGKASHKVTRIPWGKKNTDSWAGGHCTFQKEIKFLTN